MLNTRRCVSKGSRRFSLLSNFTRRYFFDSLFMNGHRHYIAEETRETYKRLSQRPQTLENALNLLVELRPLFHESLQGSRKQFQSKRLVMLRTDLYVTADLYQAKPQDKLRIVWRYKINTPLLVPPWRGGGVGGAWAWAEGGELPCERGGDVRRLA